MVKNIIQLKIKIWIFQYKLKMKEKREKAYFQWKWQRFQGRSSPGQQQTLLTFLMQLPVCQQNFGNIFTRILESASDNAHTTKMNRLIFFKKSFKKSQLFKLVAQKMGWKKLKII